MHCKACAAERKRSRREEKDRRNKEREKVNMYSGADVEITVGGVARGLFFYACIYIYAYRGRRGFSSQTGDNAVSANIFRFLETSPMISTNKIIIIIHLILLQGCSAYYSVSTLNIFFLRFSFPFLFNASMKRLAVRLNSLDHKFLLKITNVPSTAIHAPTVSFNF